jgi:hypothetical protein
VKDKLFAKILKRMADLGSGKAQPDVLWVAREGGHMWIENGQERSEEILEETAVKFPKMEWRVEVSDPGWERHRFFVDDKQVGIVLGWGIGRRKSYSVGDDSTSAGKLTGFCDSIDDAKFRVEVGYQFIAST